VPAFRWRDGLFVQEFDSEITLCRKVLKAQAKFYGWELGTISATGWPQQRRRAGQGQHGKSHWLSNERIAPSTIGHALEAGLADSK
jgi:hypothetical protein